MRKQNDKYFVTDKEVKEARKTLMNTKKLLNK